MIEMGLRDWFAGLALIGCNIASEDNMTWVARKCYDMADIMIEARGDNGVITEPVRVDG
jgi:hypothetical protein